MQSVDTSAPATPNKNINNIVNPTPEQHFIDSRWDCIILGISKNYILRYEFLKLPNGEIITIPIKDLQYSFYIKTKSEKGKDLYFKMTPSIFEKIDTDNEGGFGFQSNLSINCIDDINEALENDDICYFPTRDNISFTIINNRYSLKDDTYYFFIDDEEIGFSQCEGNCFTDINISNVEYLFDNKNITTSKYEVDLEKLKNKIKNKYELSISHYFKFSAKVVEEKNLKNGLIELSCNIVSPSCAQKQGVIVHYNPNDISVLDFEFTEAFEFTPSGVFMPSISFATGCNITNNKIYTVLLINGDVQSYKFKDKIKRVKG